MSGPIWTRWRLIFGLVLAPVALAPDAVVAQLTNTPISITAQHSGKCLDVSGASVADGAAVIQWTCQGGANQQWSLRPFLDAYQIVASHSDKCLSVEAASTADGARAIQWPCVGANNELWYASPRGSGYELVARHSAKCLAVNGGLTTDGAQVVQWSCDGSANQRWSIPAGVGSGGKWSGIINFPLVPVAAANLPDGKVLVWSARDRFAFGGDLGRTYTAIFDPATSSVTERLVSETGHDMFCPGTSMLPDGSVFVSGGSSSSKTSIYNPASDSWTTATPLIIARGYHSSATLSNGGVFTVGGSWSGGLGNKDGEVWTSGTGWRRLSGVPDDPILGADPGGVYYADNHAWLFGAGNGRVFHAGPSANMNWIDTNGSGSIVSAGSRDDDAYSMNGNAVMYDVGKILKIGGAPTYHDADATSSAYVIDINAGVSVRKVAPMAYARAMHNSVVLPNGQVVIIGGQAYAKGFSDDRSVLAPELWDPASETFTTLTPMQVPRNYHSVALLLPDGRVFSAGGGLCGGCATNHADAQILTPPYLLNADGTPAARPSIVSAPASAAHGTSVTITTDSPVSSFALMRMGSVTHSVNTDQRRVPLSHTSTGPNAYSVAIPGDPGVAIPGYYMLFALDGGGVPSVARIMRVGASPPPGAGTGLTGQYYNDPGTGTHFGTLALTRTDATVNFNWGTSSPGAGIQIDNFSVRWSGQVQAPVTGNYTFSTVSDDGVRLWVNGQLIIDNWTDHAATTNTSAAIALVAGTRYAITMEFYERGGGAVARLLWAYPGQAQIVIPQSQLFPAIASPNQAPTVSAGADQTITLPNSANLAGTASDDGQPNPPGMLTTTWSKWSGPGTVSFGDANALSTSATFSMSGAYVLRLTVWDGEITVVDDVAVTVNPAPGAAGTGLTGQYYNNPCCGTYFVTLVLTRTDPTVNFNWGSGSPGTGVQIDNFSVRWSGQVLAPVTGNYTFSTVSDDGVRLWVNGQLVINNWTDHGTTTNTSAAIALTAGVKYAITMEFYERGGGAVAQLRWAYPGQTTQIIPQSRLYPAAPSGSGTGLTGQYYNDPGTGAHFGTLALTRTDATVNFNWGTSSPGAGIQIDNFSVRWSGQVQAPVTGNYTFSTVSDDGVRLWVNGQLIIDNWTDHAATTNTSAALALVAGTRYAITMEFYERGGGAVARLLWAYPGQAQTVIPNSQLYP